MNKSNRWVGSWLLKTFLALAAGLLSAGLKGVAAIPPAEKLLPDDTLVLLTVPDFTKLREIYKSAPQGQFWSDSAMKPFRDKFVSKWQEEFVKPLERELNVKFDDYTSLPQGQVTFALTQNGWQGKDEQLMGLLVLLDTKDKSGQLKTNLADLRKKWVDAGEPIKSEKIRDIEFSVIPVSSNDVPATLKKFFPEQAQVQELGAEDSAKKTPPKSEIVIGQFESLLIMGNSTKVVEKIVGRLTGGAMPSLSELAAYNANHQALFRDAPGYGWVNVKAFIDVFNRKTSEKKNPEAPDPFASVKPEKIIAASGLAGLKTLAFNFQYSSEGSSAQFFLGVPEATRQGLFKILAGEAKESNPPNFVPADAVKFQRWRIDGQKAWATLEKMLGDISPQWVSGLNFIIDTANAAAKDKDPSFDLRKSLIGNLGDDLISYEKAARGTKPDQLKSPPSLFLLGSPNPEQLAASLKGILMFMNQQGGPPSEREFLGRKIYNVPVPSLPMGLSGDSPKPSTPRTLNYAAASGYVAMSTDTSLLEEYLRSSESQGKTLRETAGLVDATQKVTGPGTALFGYENQTETMRTAFETLKKDSSSGTAGDLSSLPGALGVAGPGKLFKDWMDFSLLPAFDKVSKYFHFAVYGESATVDGLTLKVFAPVPPGLKK